ncbi:Protein kinase C-binding protein 1 [Saguinus oedipus]|uniref:Protein kinase C-binding protein 1 n=1 Tax=Saguinus oedipus TaxID=9490 RepID=A0ABQ9VFA0_SAGOE|nr:Protein kinase C-binding protein 1 [Saguinus oedipus]
MYGCTEAFLADAKLILHNCIICNGGNHELTQIAKVVIKICEHEMNEIETKSIFNSAMQEMEVYVENIHGKFGVFNYSPFRTPYMPNSQYQILLNPSNHSASTAKIDKQEKVKLNFDMTASPKILMSKPVLSRGTGSQISLSDMPCSPMSTNSSMHTGSDMEQDA